MFTVLLVVIVSFIGDFNIRTTHWTSVFLGGGVAMLHQ